MSALRHGMFIELITEDERTKRDYRGNPVGICRLETCAKCGVECPHEFVCLQPSGPRVWEMQCTWCRGERRRLEREE